MGVLYFLAASVCSATLVVLTAIVPLPWQVRSGGQIRPTWVLSILWLLAVLFGAGYLIQQTLTGVDEGLLPLVLLAVGPGVGIAVVRIALALRAFIGARNQK